MISTSKPEDGNEDDDKEVTKNMTAEELEKHAKARVQQIITEKVGLTEEEKIEKANK